MTNDVLVRGAEWSGSLLYDPASWGMDVTESQAEALGELVRIRFHKLAAEAGCSAYWLPNASEVVGDISDDVTEEQLDQWRRQAIAPVWSAVVDESSDDAELTAKVEVIFESD